MSAVITARAGRCATRTTTPAAHRRRVPLGLLACLVLAVNLAFAGLGSGAASADVAPGTIVVARQSGDVVALLPNGTVTELATGLGQVQSLTVLADGTMLTTDFTGNRIMGFGGRLGPTPVEVATVNQPVGISVGSDGSIYLTTLDGAVARVDVDARAVVPFASGLTLPGTPAEREGIVYVPQGFLGLAAVSPVDGSVVPVGAPVGEPGAAAAAMSTPILLSDTKNNRVLRFDPATAETDEFVVVTAPGPIAIDTTPTSGQAWSLLVGTPTAVVRVDARGLVQERIEVEGPITGVGQATVNIPVDGDAGSSSTSVVKQSDSGDDGGFPMAIIVAILVAAVVVLAVVALVKRSSWRESGADWFKSPPSPPERSGATRTPEPEEPPASSDRPDPPPGSEPPVPSQPQLTPEQEQLVEIRSELAVLTQSAAAVARRASTFREMVSRALDTRTNARIAREKEALMSGTPSAPLTADGVDFHTAAGRELFDAHQRGEVDNAALRSGWSELGERDALEQVFRFGDSTDRLDLSAPSTDEREAAREAFDARQQLVEVEAEQARLTTEINRLRGLEAELNRRTQGPGGAPAPQEPRGQQSF